MNEYEWHLLEDKNRVESLEIDGAEVRCGDRVRLRPRQGGDVFDVALAGRVATIEAIEQDYEGQFHLSVVVDEDPGRDMGMARQPGHRFFFAPNEVEPMGPNGDAASAAAVRTPTILIAGIGNIFLGDDAFGVEVAQRLAGKKLPRGVRAIDFGIRGFDLAYALLDGTDVTILVGCLPARRKARDALRDRAGFGFARRARRGIRAAGGWARDESSERAAPGENAGRAAEENPVSGLRAGIARRRRRKNGIERYRHGFDRRSRAHGRIAGGTNSRRPITRGRNHGESEKRRVEQCKRLSRTEMDTTDKETLYMLGGIALVVFGAGLILSNPTIRKYMGEIGIGGLAQNIVPDVERYFKLRAM